jgi:hypothetical protein
MISCRRFFDDGGPALRMKPGQQNGTFHLGARYFGSMRNSVQTPTVDGERRASVRRVNRRAHAGQGLDHAPHRAPRQGGVARDHAAERVTGEQARDQAHRGARVRGVEGACRGAQAAQAPAANHDLGLAARNPRAKGFHAGQRGCAVGAGRVAAQTRLAVGDGREHRVAVGDRFVAGDSQASGDSRDTRNEGRSSKRDHRDDYCIILPLP